MTYWIGFFVQYIKLFLKNISHWKLVLPKPLLEETSIRSFDITCAVFYVMQKMHHMHQKIFYEDPHTFERDLTRINTLILETAYAEYKVARFISPSGSAAYKMKEGDVEYEAVLNEEEVLMTRKNILRACLPEKAYDFFEQYLHQGGIPSYGSATLLDMSTMLMPQKYKIGGNPGNKEDSYKIILDHQDIYKFRIEAINHHTISRFNDRMTSALEINNLKVLSSCEVEIDLHSTEVGFDKIIFSDAKGRMHSFKVINVIIEVNAQHQKFFTEMIHKSTEFIKKTYQKINSKKDNFTFVQIKYFCINQIKKFIEIIQSIFIKSKIASFFSSPNNPFQTWQIPKMNAPKVNLRLPSKSHVLIYKTHARDAIQKMRLRKSTSVFSLANQTNP